MTQDPQGFRIIGEGQAHARTELSHKGRYFSASGTGQEVRDMLTKHVEGLK